MKKGILVLAAIFFMVLMVMPMDVQAEGNPRVGMRYSDYQNGSTVENTGFMLESSMVVEVGSNIPIFLYFVDENGQENRLDFENVRPGNAEAFSISKDSNVPGMMYIAAQDVANTEIIYTHNGTDYTMPVYVILPAVGFYSGTTATAAGLITEFTVTDASNIFYAVADDGVLENINLTQEFVEIASIEVSQDKSYATITVNGNPKNGGWYGVEYSYRNSQSEYVYSNYKELILYNKKTGLQCVSPDWSGATPKEGIAYVSDIEMNMDTSFPLYFYYISGDEKVRIETDKLYSSDESIIQVNSTEWPGMVKIVSKGFGTALLKYDHSDGKTYSMKVDVVLPDVAFYSTPVATIAGYINEFDVTDDGENTFYFVAKEGTLESATLAEDFGKIATSTISNDKTYATITVNGSPLNGHFYDVNYQYYYKQSSNINEGSKAIKVNNVKKGLKFSWPSWENGSIVEPDEFGGEFKPELGRDRSIFIYFYDGVNTELVDVSKLYSSNESAIQIREYDSTIRGLASIKMLEFGKTSIQYDHTDGKTYTLEVNMELPEIGIYSKPVATEENYIQEFSITDEGPNKFYVVCQRGVLDTVMLNELEGLATVQKSKDNTYAEITVTGDTFKPNYSISVWNIIEQQAVYRECYVNLLDRRTSLQYSLQYFTDDGYGPGNLMRNPIELDKTYLTKVYMYFVQGDSKQLLKHTDLVSTDESVIRIEQSETDPDMVKIESVDFGKAAVTYTDSDGKVYSVDVVVGLPDVGFYSENKRSEETFISQCVTAGNQRTFYFIAKEGIIFDEMEADENLKKVGTVTLSEDKTYGTIVITGTPEKRVDYGVKYRYHDEKGYNTGSGTKYLEYIFLVDLEVEELPTVKPSEPVENVTVGVEAEAKEVLSEVTSELIDDLNSGKEVEGISEEVYNSIKNAIANKSDLKLSTSVEIESIDEGKIQDASAREDILAIKNSKGDGIIAEYLDLSVVLTTYVNGNKEANCTIPELSEPIVFTVALPEKIKNVPDGYERSIEVLYVHNGQVKTIPATKNPDGTISFEANEFSIYALMYKDIQLVDPIIAFVTRMYQLCLSRDPDQSGLEGWYYQLQNRYMTGADIAKQFIFGQEMIDRNLSDAAFVEILYKALMGREADEAGKAGWVSQLQKGNMTRMEVTKAFAESTEFTQICADYGITRGTYDASEAMLERFVLRFYNLCLERSADQPGLYGWVSNLKKGYMDGARIADVFFFGKEFIDKSTTNQKYIELLYTTILGRKPDSSETAGWISQLQKGNMTRMEIMKSFIESVEFTDICNTYGITRGTYDASDAKLERFVLRFYSLCLEREADQPGLYGWVSNLKNKYMNGAQMADAFFFSEEFLDKSVSNEKYVELLYKTILGRDPAASETAGWIYQLENEFMSRRDIMEAFIESKEFTDICNTYGIVRGSL